MNNEETILFFKSLERNVRERENAVNSAKEILKKAKDAYDTAVNELCLAIRNDSDQMPIPFTDAIVLDESRQIPENKTGAEEFAEEPANVLTLPERPAGDDHTEDPNDVL